jgi:hypothetical protein
MLLGSALQAAEPATTTAGATPPAAAAAAPVPAPAQESPAPAADQAAPVATPAAPTTAPPAAQPARRASADRVELGATQITGNAELPRVMYVVPWKRTELGDLAGKPAKSLLDEVLAPVDRDVFRRQVRYYEALRPDEQPKEP